MLVANHTLQHDQHTSGMLAQTEPRIHNTQTRRYYMKTRPKTRAKRAKTSATVEFRRNATPTPLIMLQNVAFS